MPGALTTGEYYQTMGALDAIAGDMQRLLDTFYAPKGPHQWYECTAAMGYKIDTLQPALLQIFMVDLQRDVMSIENDGGQICTDHDGLGLQDDPEMHRLHGLMQGLLGVVQRVRLAGRPPWSAAHDRARQERGGRPARPGWIRDV